MYRGADLASLNSCLHTAALPRDTCISLRFAQHLGRLTEQFMLEPLVQNSKSYLVVCQVASSQSLVRSATCYRQVYNYYSKLFNIQRLHNYYISWLSYLRTLTNDFTRSFRVTHLRCLKTHLLKINLYLFVLNRPLLGPQTHDRNRSLIVIVNSRFLEFPQKRSRGNQLIHMRLTRTKSKDRQSDAGLLTLL